MHRRFSFPPLAMALLLLGCGCVANAQTDREALIEAWAANMPEMPGTVAFERRGDDLFYLEDDNLPYRGEVRIIGGLVRPAGETTGDGSLANIGIVEFELTELDPDWLETQSYYYWLSDRQTLYYSDAEQRWLSVAEFRATFDSAYADSPSFGVLTFMLSYGIWAVLLLLLLWAFVAVHRQHKRARSIMDESSSINVMARENLERAAELQNESMQIAREILEIERGNRQVLEQIRDKMAG